MRNLGCFFSYCSQVFRCFDVYSFLLQDTTVAFRRGIVVHMHRQQAASRVHRKEASVKLFVLHAGIQSTHTKRLRCSVPPHSSGMRLRAHAQK